ncbi:phosphopantetheine-binding protein [Mycoplasmopsis columboralis]|nr:phosphopantetheine-binding protein [Mycoplasmopsis columboralis]
MNKSVKEIVLNELKKYTKKSFGENTLLAELNIDSLDLAEIIIEAEEKFGIEIADEELMKVKTINDIILLIEKSKN